MIQESYIELGRYEKLLSCVGGASRHERVGSNYTAGSSFLGLRIRMASRISTREGGKNPPFFSSSSSFPVGHDEG